MDEHDDEPVGLFGTPAEAHRLKVIFVILSVAVAIAVILAHLSSGSLPPASNAGAAAPPVSAPVAHQLRYFVNVSGGTHTLITYANDQGGTEQVDYTGPWDKTYSAFPSGAGAYISVLNETGRGSSVECQIILDGAVVRVSTGTSLVSCQGAVP